MMQIVFSYALYFLAIVFWVYAILQFRLGFYFLKSLKRLSLNENKLKKKELPRVTIQLPIYNEINMVSSLLQAVKKIDYPQELMQVQILDDSTDETSSIIEAFLKDNDKSVFFHIKRKKRKGYKAGALHEGLMNVTGQYVAIFDADFLPPKDFFYKTLPYFKEKNVAFVQTRWGHVNEKKSLLTAIQAFALDMHFTVEQGGRFFSGDFIQFNGTAGVFKKSVIEEAGGWSSDTVVEDLDLSFRIQMLGYKGIYARDIICPAELPSTIEALRIQQTRWIGGGAACFKKLNRKVLLSTNIPINKRIFALFHLFHSSMFLFVFSTLILSISSGLFFDKLNGVNLFTASLIFSFSLFSLVFIYAISFWVDKKRKLVEFPVFVLSFLLFIALNFGFSFNHFVAIIKGYRKKIKIFHRTPKNNSESNLTTYKSSEKRNLFSLMEFFIFLALLFSFLISLKNKDYKFFFIHVLALIGYGWVVFRSVKKMLNFKT